MNFIKTDIDGLVIIEPKVFADKRGYFFELYNYNEFAANGIDCRFVQDNQSSSSRGTIRGLHFQKGDAAQAKLVRVIAGAVIDAAVDLRPDSPTYGMHIAVELSDKNHRMLFVPRGFAHGFAALTTPAVFTYKVDNFYNPSAEGGIRYDDPKLNIEWRVPMNEIIVAEKDMKLPFLKDWQR